MPMYVFIDTIGFSRPQTLVPLLFGSLYWLPWSDARLLRITPTLPDRFLVTSKGQHKEIFSILGLRF
jgi:hypothetical protein